jgi:transcriptional regulator
MYRPPVFREDRPEVLHDAIRAHPLAMLVTHGEEGLVANLVPFTLVERGGGQPVLRAHLARVNSQLRDLEQGCEALVIFQGPQAYVSPSWYPSKQVHGKVVPTWNYVVVQAWGRPLVIDDAKWLLAQIEALTALQEGRRDEPWAVDDAPADFIAGQLKGVRGVEIPVDRIEGKWKASQNQSTDNRAGVVAGLRASDPASPMAAIVQQHGVEAAL